MRISLITVCLAVTTASAFSAEKEKPVEEPKAVSLFDGKSFDSWEGNLDVFRIEEGAFVGG